jgi:hypothetical protein
MFRVENADFIADKLASELLPDQEQREVYKNAEEAVARRIAAGESDPTGRIEFDVDWPMHERTGKWFVSCADDGDGMSRSELTRYMTTLAVQGANQNQSIIGNQGMGLKIAGPTRHKNGVLIRSLKNGELTMVQVGWNGHEYGLIPLGANGEEVVPVEDELFPKFILARGSGTVVTFLGTNDEDTFLPGDRARGWLFKYLHQRFFRLSEGGIETFVRVPSGDSDDWPRSREEADARQRKEGGKSFNLSKVRGTAAIWDDAASRQGEGYHYSLEVPGEPSADIPAARIHWWVLPSGPGTDVSTRTASGGSVAVLFQNELHDWRISNQANPYFARMGVLFGKNRIGFVVEPLGTTISSDFARAHVLVGGTAVFESDAWLTWSEQFREAMPEKIKETMAEEQARLEVEDPDRARRIRDRLKDVMQLLRPRRFKRDSEGKLIASGPSVTGPGVNNGSIVEKRVGPGRRRNTSSTRGIGAVLTQVDGADAEAASEVFSLLQISPQWVSESEADSFALVQGEGKGLHDRAAALAGEDGATAGILLLNRDFRGYQAILATINEWANPDGDEDIAKKIETFAQEWVEQKMVEAVNGLRQLENGSTWTATNFDDALSPVALTAAFMADRYHTLREVKRQVGPLRQTVGT